MWLILFLLLFCTRNLQKFEIPTKTTKVVMFSVFGSVFQGFRENETTENPETKGKSNSTNNTCGQKIASVFIGKYVQTRYAETQELAPRNETQTKKIEKYTKRLTDAISFDHDVSGAAPFQLNSHRGQNSGSTSSWPAENETDQKNNKRENFNELKMSNFVKKSTKATKTNGAVQATTSLRDLFLKSNSSNAAENSKLEQEAIRVKKLSKRAGKLTKTISTAKEDGKTEETDLLPLPPNGKTGNSFVVLEASSDEENSVAQEKDQHEQTQGVSILKEIMGEAAELSDGPLTDKSDNEDSENDSQLSGEEDLETKWRNSDVVDFDEISKKLIELSPENLAERYRSDELPDFNRPVDQAFTAFEIWKEGFRAPRPSYRTIEAYDIVTNMGEEVLIRYHTPDYMLDENKRWIGRKDTLIYNIHLNAPDIYYVDSSQPIGHSQKIQLHITQNLSMAQALGALSVFLHLPSSFDWHLIPRSIGGRDLAFAGAISMAKTLSLAKDCSRPWNPNYPYPPPSHWVAMRPDQDVGANREEMGHCWIWIRLRQCRPTTMAIECTRRRVGEETTRQRFPTWATMQHRPWHQVLFRSHG
jgi:hypothetical protein